MHKSITKIFIILSLTTYICGISITAQDVTSNNTAAHTRTRMRTRTLQKKNQTKRTSKNGIQIPLDLRESILATFSNDNDNGNENSNQRTLAKNSKSKKSKKGKQSKGMDMNTKSSKASKGSKGMTDHSTSTAIVDANVDMDIDGDTNANSTFNAVSREFVFPTSSPPTSSPPTSSPSFSPTLNFELSECSTYDYYWKKDLYETCGDDWTTCACPGAQRRIENGDINCSTASCPSNCDVCYLCLMEFNDCVSYY